MRMRAAEYTESDLARVLARDFDEASRSRVLEILGRYGVEEWHREPRRVRMACLKLAGGDLAALERQVGIACSDYRDVLGPAEYPSYDKAKTEEEKERAIEKDWRALQAWLMRE